MYLLTGTPLTNRPRDLFVLLQLVGHSLGRSFLSFAKRYCAAEKTDFGWKTDGASNLEELTVQLHGVMLRRSKDQVLSLPPKLRTWLPVDVPQGTGVREIREVVDLLLGDGEPAAGDPTRWTMAGSADDLLALLTRARQKLAVREGGRHQRLRVRRDRAGREGHRLLVLRRAAAERSPKHFGDAAVLLTGSTPADKRQALVDRFQQDETVRVFLANIIAGGVGTQPDRREPGRLQRSRLGARQSLAGGGPRLPHRADADGQRDLPDRRGHGGRFRPDGARDEGALVSAVVDGKALAGDLSGSVLDELQRALRAISPGLADTPSGIVDEELIERLLRAGASGTRRPPQPRRRGASAHAPRTSTRSDARSRRSRGAVRTVGEPLPHREHVAARRRLRHHGSTART